MTLLNTRRLQYDEKVLSKFNDDEYDFVYVDGTTLLNQQDKTLSYISQK